MVTKHAGLIEFGNGNIYPPSSHEIILPILRTILVTRPLHILLGEDIVIRMVLLPLLLLPLLHHPRLLLLPDKTRRLVALPQLLQPILALLLQIRLLLDLGLVEAVDDGVLALRDEDALHLPRVLEGDLPDGHGAVLLEVGPRRVDDGDVVLLVALDGVGLGQLREVGEEGLGDGVPGHGGGGGGVGVREAEVDVCGGELVDVELLVVS